MKSMIQPRLLKGFRDSKPSNEIPKKKLINKLENIFESYGFLPIDTPVLEYTEVLLGKGGGETDKQLYRFKDNGKRDIAMRFDLTVPFARFMASYHHELALPFKRYHINKVWRGENTQKGRYREFMQCDFDIVGCDSAEADFEILSMMSDSFKALDIDQVQFKLSHRSLFNDFLIKIQLHNHLPEILRIVDKLAKVGEENIRSDLAQYCNETKINQLLEFISIRGDFKISLEKAQGLIGDETKAISRLKEIYRIAQECDLANRFELDLSITRGLDYYTGIVYETMITQLPSIGSVCSGGRYNNLASLYTKDELAGVGSSIGLDRLMAALEELSLINKEFRQSDVILFNLDKSLSGYYFKLANQLRQEGINCEIYLNHKKMGTQFKYAESKNIPIALLLGSNEVESGTFTLKDLNARKNYTLNSFNELQEKICNILE